MQFFSQDEYNLWKNYGKEVADCTLAIPSMPSKYSDNNATLRLKLFDSCELFCLRRLGN